MAGEKDIWIFLSHSSADFDKVRLIRNYLEEKKCRPLMFYLKCLNSEEETFELIKREIDVRTRFVVCDSDNARASKWVRKEIEYITGKEPKRSYLRLDLKKPIAELKEEVAQYVLKTYVFLSYKRSMCSVAQQVCSRLEKYDLRIFFDMRNIKSGIPFEHQIRQAVQSVSQSGYFILLLDGTPTEYIRRELSLAKESQATIIAITVSANATASCLSELQLPFDEIVQLDDYVGCELSDKIVDEILWRVLPTGAVHTFAHNFRTGTNGKKDGDEADKLDGLLVRKAETSHNHAALVFLAKCYENGEHGLPVDLHKASMYYGIAIHEEGREDLIPHARELNARIYGCVENNVTSNVGLAKRSEKHGFFSWVLTSPFSLIKKFIGKDKP